MVPVQVRLMIIKILDLFNKYSSLKPANLLLNKSEKVMNLVEQDQIQQPEKSFVTLERILKRYQISVRKEGEIY